MFFCKDCDGVRVREKRVAIFGANNEAVEYALGMLHYSACVMIADERRKAALERATRPVDRGI